MQQTASQSQKRVCHEEECIKTNSNAKSKDFD